MKAKAAVESPSQADTENRLLPRVEKKGGYWVLREEFRTSLNPAEKVKNQKITPQKLTRTKISTGCTWVGATTHSTGTPKSVNVCSVLEFKSV